MNIFVTSIDPVACAKALDDKRLVKMVLETAQLLSTVHRRFNTAIADMVYKPTHQYHPCSVWLAQSLGNYDWLLAHFNALCAEYTYRYGRKHMSEDKFATLFNRVKPRYELLGITPFANCTPYKDIKDTLDAYRQTMRDKWREDMNPCWSKRGQPDWRYEQTQLEV
jgi:hypothetical protein